MIPPGVTNDENIASNEPGDENDTSQEGCSDHVPKAAKTILVRHSVGLALFFEHLSDTLEGPADTVENIAGQGMSSNAHVQGKSTLIPDYWSLKGLLYSTPLLVSLTLVVIFFLDSRAVLLADP